MNDIRCPECGGETTIRPSKKDGRKFYVCADYPWCKGKVKYQLPPKTRMPLKKKQAIEEILPMTEITRRFGRLGILTQTVLMFLDGALILVLLLPEVFTTSILGVFLAFPPIGLVYVFIMTIIWWGFFGVISATSWLWEKINIIRLVLIPIGIIFVLVTETFFQLMPNPDREDKYLKSLYCASWPFTIAVIKNAGR
jgi:ssDNA-binding Zn-finger/Zn-ribbon topoisomerase 1